MIFTGGGSWLGGSGMEGTWELTTKHWKRSVPFIPPARSVALCLVLASSHGGGECTWIPGHALRVQMEVGCQSCGHRIKPSGAKSYLWELMDCFLPAYSNNPAHFMWDKLQDLATLAPRGWHFCDSWHSAPGSLRGGEGLPYWLMTCGLLTSPQGCCSRSRVGANSNEATAHGTGWERALKRGTLKDHTVSLNPIITVGHSEGPGMT